MYQRALMSGGGQGGSPLATISMVQDEKIKDAALKELPLHQSHEATKASMMNAMDTMYQNSVARNYNPQAAQKYNAALAALKSNTVDLYGGKSETEFDDIAKGFASGMFTNPQTLQQQKQILLQKADSQKSFPVLESIGIIKKAPTSISFTKGK